jgi:hypothetical protein
VSPGAASLVAGALIAFSAMAGLFFLRFWRDTGERLFACFAIAFWLLGSTGWGWRSSRSRRPRAPASICSGSAPSRSSSSASSRRTGVRRRDPRAACAPRPLLLQRLAMRWERALLTAGGAALVFWLAFDSRILTTEPPPAGLSAALGVLGAIFGMGSFVMQRGGQPERVPMLAGLSAGALGYAVARVALGF